MPGEAGRSAGDAASLRQDGAETLQGENRRSLKHDFRREFELCLRYAAEPKHGAFWRRRFCRRPEKWRCRRLQERPGDVRGLRQCRTIPIRHRRFAGRGEGKSRARRWNYCFDRAAVGSTCDSNSPSVTRVRIFVFGFAAAMVRITLPAESVVML